MPPPPKLTNFPVLRYRPNVAGIVRRAADGRILVCERLDIAGAWQFPQGGRRRREEAEEALVREMEEEISLRPEHYRIVARKGPYRYYFPNGRVKNGYVGQEQTYFLLELTGPESVLDVRTVHPEFRSWQWILPEEFQVAAWLPEMKRQVYRDVLRDFFGVEEGRAPSGTGAEA